MKSSINQLKPCGFVELDQTELTCTEGGAWVLVPKLVWIGTKWVLKQFLELITRPHFTARAPG